jgi:hypothetical protein
MLKMSSFNNEANCAHVLNVVATIYIVTWMAQQEEWVT